MAQVTALWRGEVPLATTGGLYGLLGMLILTTPLTLVASLGTGPLAKSLLLSLSVATLLYAPFIAVAVWRSAGKHRGRPVWRLLAKGSVLFVGLQVVAGIGLG